MVFVPKVLLVLRSETCDEIVVFFSKQVEQRGYWTVHALFLADPRESHERDNYGFDVIYFIRLWEWLSAPLI